MCSRGCVKIVLWVGMLDCNQRKETEAELFRRPEAGYTGLLKSPCASVRITGTFESPCRTSVDIHNEINN